MRIENRKARYDYHIVESYEAGICLLGSEVKQLKSGKGSIVDAYCFFNNNQLILKSTEIPVANNAFQHEPRRDRQLLLHKRELHRLKSDLTTGMSIVPLVIYEKKGRIKVNIALVRGKRDYDKRQDIKEREDKRRMKDL